MTAFKLEMTPGVTNVWLDNKRLDNVHSLEVEAPIDGVLSVTIGFNPTTFSTTRGINPPPIPPATSAKPWPYAGSNAMVDGVSVDWWVSPEEANYAARDTDGSWYWLPEEPIVAINGEFFLSQPAGVRFHESRFEFGHISLLAYARP